MIHSFEIPAFLQEECENFVAKRKIKGNVYLTAEPGGLERTNLTGTICENFVKLLYGKNPEALDFGTDLNVNDVTTDVKGQHFNMGTPTGNWWLNFSDRQKQVGGTDEFVYFTMHNSHTKKIYLMGYMKKKDFFDSPNTLFVPAGSPLPNPQRTPAEVDTWCIQAKHLHPISEAKFKMHKDLQAIYPF